MTHPSNKPTLDQLEAELAPTLRDFRAASALYAERERSPLPARLMAPETRSPLAHWRRWTLAATMACALVTTASFKLLKPAPKLVNAPVASKTTEPKTISDEALLENVASDLSTSVPTPLQSLAPQQSTSTTTVNQ